MTFNFPAVLSPPRACKIFTGSPWHSSIVCGCCLLVRNTDLYVFTTRCHSCAVFVQAWKHSSQIKAVEFQQVAYWCINKSSLIYLDVMNFWNDVISSDWGIQALRSYKIMSTQEYLNCKIKWSNQKQRGGMIILEWSELANTWSIWDCVELLCLLLYLFLWSLLKRI